jgi:DNA-binding helix-hairpin-helix protein with protein kinase domain
MQRFADTSGQPIRVGARLGAGGEGSVHEVDGRPDTVAKIYHKPLTPERAQKIVAMASLSSPELQRATAWPSGILLADGHTPHGLLMPRVAGCKDIHKLYSPKSRKSEFPAADFRFLLSVATNVARAFAVVHQNHCVIGDVNHGSITVAQNATVKLIDCDSFQIAVNGHTYLCEVGVPTFTPPELQGRPFRGIARTANHDSFSLAVLIFHLLFMGRHAFAGRYLGRGDMPIETAIQQFRFAYGADRKLTQMEPPPYVPSLASMSPAIATLFERALSRQATNGHARPSPSEWIAALDAAAHQLVRCKREPTHYYVTASSSCPWCEVEHRTGVVLFNLSLPAFIPLPGRAHDRDRVSGHTQDEQGELQRARGNRAARASDNVAGRGARYHLRRIINTRSLKTRGVPMRSDPCRICELRQLWEARAAQARELERLGAALGPQEAETPSHAAHSRCLPRSSVHTARAEVPILG